MKRLLLLLLSFLLSQFYFFADTPLSCSIENGTELYVEKRTDKKYTVDGITEYWYYVYSYELPIAGWVFGGVQK